MIGCLGSTTATNLLAEFFLLNNHGHIINALRVPLSTSEHLSTHSSFNAYGLLTLVRNPGHNISDRFWFPYTRSHIVVGFQFGFIDRRISLISSLRLGIFGLRLFSAFRLLLLYLYQKLISRETFSRYFLSWWWIILVIVLFTLCCFGLNGVLCVETRSRFWGNLKPCILMLHWHHGRAVVVGMIQLWLVTHHLLLVLFGKGTNDEAFRIDVAWISFWRMSSVKTISRIPATHRWQLWLFKGSCIVLLSIGLIYRRWTLLQTRMVAK